MNKPKPYIQTEPVLCTLEPFGDVTLYHQTDQYNGHRWRFSGIQTDWHQDNAVALDELFRKINIRYKTNENIRRSKQTTKGVFHLRESNGIRSEKIKENRNCCRKRI